MNIDETLYWDGFKAALLRNPELYLQFEYGQGKFVSASYHITEIKQAAITSVDCGGVVNQWTEVIVQLWEPAARQQERAMTVSKALSIVDLVERALPLNGEAIVKIEFGNAEFDTRQMYPSSLSQNGDNLIVTLHADKTQCKAISRGGSCGTTGTAEECSEPAKPKVQLVNLAAAVSCCSPGGGCC